MRELERSFESLQGKRLNIKFEKSYDKYYAWWQRPYSYEVSRKPLSVLVYRDSFARWLSPFLTATFGESTFVRGPWSKKFMECWVKRTHPDIVILEVVERNP